LNLLRNLLRNPAEPDLALHGTLLNLTWLCTKASQTFSGTYSGTLLNLTCGSAPKPPRPSPGTFSGTLLNLTWLHQSLPDLLQNLLRNLLRNPVKPDLWLCTKASPTFSGTLKVVEPDPAPPPVHTGAILG